ncbi:MAG: hypothetical protein K6G58_07665 [Lachnospiraceae bacterium]|nr:hypothetical protein [Lachnospiraceae bacterium]
MKKRIAVFLMASVMLLLSGCSVNIVINENGREGQPETAGQEEAAEQEEAVGQDDADNKARGGIPWMDSEIKSNVTQDLKTDPRDDFHLYANKEWLLENEIPEGHSSWSHYMERSLDVKKQCMQILKDESIEGHDAKVIRTYNRLILDWDAREKLGVSEIEDMYRRLTGIGSIDDLNSLYEDKESLSELFAFFGWGTSTGFNDPDSYIVAVSTPGLLLDDSAEYKERTEYGDMLYSYRKDVFVYMAERMGMAEDDAAKCFDDAIAFEGRLAEKIYTTMETKRDDYFEKVNNEMKLEDLTGRCKNFPIGMLLDVSGYSYDGNYLVVRPDYFDHLDKLYTDENIDGIKSCLIVKYLLGYTRSIDRDAYEYSNEVRNRIFGMTGMLSDDEMAYNSVSAALPTSMQKVYISEYGSEEDKQKMEDLCRKVIDSYREMLKENDWASDEVKENAIKKLDNMVIHAAYPDKFRDTSRIDIDGCTLIEADRRLNEYEVEYEKSLIGKKIDKDMWAEGFDILSCNAFYDSSHNTINMIIGMMGEPFYSSDMPTEELYASIGAFWVGHEISHAFDSNGSQFDENGNLRNWWTDDDRKEFSRRVKKMDDYLDGIVAFGNEHFIGTNVDTEMVADMTGVQCALRMASEVEGFDYDRFFKKYAQMNVSLGLYSSELSQLRQDEHPLDYARTNVPVQQFEEFYETYDVREGDNMYLAPQDRLVIW